MSFTVYAAIDLAGGRAVRLRQGRRDSVRVVAEDPLALAQSLIAAGAPFLHLVDLDAAFGDGGNDAVIGAILAGLACPVQVGGGVRDASRFRRLRQLGAARVILGTAAMRGPALLEEVLADDPDAVVVAADTCGGRIVVSGWTEESAEEVDAFAARMREVGVRHLLTTAVERDGTGRGPDHAVLGRALKAFGPGVIASGGVGSVADVAALRPLAAHGLAGVVVGSLLVDGRVSVAELLAAAHGGGRVESGRATGFVGASDRGSGGRGGGAGVSGRRPPEER